MLVFQGGAVVVLLALSAVRSQTLSISKRRVQPAEGHQHTLTAADDGASDPSLSSTDAAADLTQYVNIFVGTEANGDPGDVFAGASIPFGMAKVTINVEGYAPAGYMSPSDQPTRGVSPLHDSGTGSSDGSYGNYCIMPVLCQNGDINYCPTLLDSRKRLRLNNTDRGSPGYFTTTLDNGIQIEVTSTRRSTLEKYTFPASQMQALKSGPHLVLDWTNDSPGTFSGGELKAIWSDGRLMMNGTWRSSFGPGTYNAYQCVDMLHNGRQAISSHAFFGGNREGIDAKRTDMTHWIRGKQFVGQYQAGAVVGFGRPSEQDTTIMVRRGVSFKSADKACENMEIEIPDWDFDRTVAASKEQWQDKLQRIQLSANTSDYIRRLFYTSYYRTFLSPNNATDDGPFDTKAPYFDGLYCSWDTFRTLFPFMALSSPREYAEIVATYLDGYDKQGWLPECRANQVKGYVQGGNDGVPILADFAVKYAKQATSLGIDVETLWKAMQHDIDVTSPQWEIEGRQASPFQKFGYIPFGYLDAESVGEQTREASRSLEYCFGDFTAAMTAQALGKSTAIIARYRKSALQYALNFDQSVTSDGYDGFVQKRFANGTFVRSDPTFCSPLDLDSSHSCSLQPENSFGTYESSSWEYSFYAPQDGAGLVKLLGGNRTFEERLDHFFSKGYYGPGNEPSFDTPSMYHHIGKPYKSIRRVRNVIYSYFSLQTGGLPGNDDNAAMASLLSFYLLGLYPVPGTREFMILSPLMPSYTIDNEVLGKLTVTVTGFDPTSLAKTIPRGSNAFVEKVLIDGKTHSSRCRIDFNDLFAGKLGQERRVEIVMTSQEIDGCGDSASDWPASLSTGGFVTV